MIHKITERFLPLDITFYPENEARPGQRRGYLKLRIPVATDSFAITHDALWSFSKEEGEESYKNNHFDTWTVWPSKNDPFRLEFSNQHGAETPDSIMVCYFANWNSQDDPEVVELRRANEERKEALAELNGYDYVPDFDPSAPFYIDEGTYQDAGNRWTRVSAGIKWNVDENFGNNIIMNLNDTYTATTYVKENGLSWGTQIQAVSAPPSTWQTRVNGMWENSEEEPEEEEEESPAIKAGRAIATHIDNDLIASLRKCGKTDLMNYHVRKATKELAAAKEEEIRDQLKSLGWTPPIPS